MSLGEKMLDCNVEYDQNDGLRLNALQDPPMKIPNRLLLKSAISGGLAALTLCMSMNAVAQAPKLAVPAPATPALAPPAPPAEIAVSSPAPKYAASDVQRAFSVIDSNHDGQLSRAEAASFKNVAKHFDAADANKDGLLSRAEFDNALNGPRVQ